MSPQPRGLTGRTSFAMFLIVGVLAAMLTAPAAQARPVGTAPSKASAPGGAGHADRADRAARAQDALTRADSVLHGRASTAKHRNATLALRDLWRLRDSLSGADLARADRLLARPTYAAPKVQGDRPTGEQVTCDVTCVHWTNFGQDAPAQDDLDLNTIPDYVDTVAATMTSVNNAYVAAGYRAPKPDGVLGGDARPDIYLADIGPQGLYGYCTTDQDSSPQGRFDVWAYCVLDNDYSTAEFPTNTPVENLQVTAAHEYFHAVQFAYDILEDGWFMEASSTWAEDELYDGVDDNLQYLKYGPLGRPDIAMDKFIGLHHYGDWIFLRYLTERFTSLQGTLPSLILAMWRKADSASGPSSDRYSVQAISAVLGAHGTSLTTMFTKFADANRRPAASYSEGAANHYPTAKPDGKFTLSRHKKDTRWLVLRGGLDHLTSSTVRFVSAGGLKRLKVRPDLADKNRGSSVIVTVYLNNGHTTTSNLPLNKRGDGAKTFPFTSKVKFIEVTLVNASTKFTNCWHGTPYSCSGTARYDNSKTAIRAIASN